MMEPSIFLAVFPYALIASFPILGIIVVTKWNFDDKRRKKRRQIGQVTGNPA